MKGSSASGATQEPDDENMPDQRFTRGQAAYSLSALTAALVMAAFGTAFAYRRVDDGNSSHVHGAESSIHSYQDVGHSVDDDMNAEMILPGEEHDGVTLGRPSDS